MLESTRARGKIDRPDVRVLLVPAVATADKMGASQAANMVMLGAYVGTTGAISAELVEKELERRFADRAAVLSRNKQAFAEGVKMAANLKPL